MSMPGQATLTVLQTMIALLYRLNRLSEHSGMQMSRESGRGQWVRVVSRNKKPGG